MAETGTYHSDFTYFLARYHSQHLYASINVSRLVVSGMFLDEIADMPTQVQTTVFRVLQERQVVRAGAKAAILMDFAYGIPPIAISAFQNLPNLF